jgi:hypothetical protein
MLLPDDGHRPARNRAIACRTFRFAIELIRASPDTFDATLQNADTPNVQVRAEREIAYVCETAPSPNASHTSTRTKDRPAFDGEEFRAWVKRRC